MNPAVDRYTRFDISKDAVVWHYTSRETLEHFIKPGAHLYATHYKCLNDKVEREYGLREYERIVSKNKYPMSITDYLSKYEAFVFSFSGLRDDLSQWRAYTPSIGGIAIGFWDYMIFDQNSEIFTQRSVELARALTKNSAAQSGDICFYERCFYGPRLVQERLKNGFPNGGYVTENDYIHQGAFFTVHFCKHPCFKSEKEKRIALITQNVENRIEIIAGKPRIKTPFHDFGGMIAEIMISPHGDQEMNYEFVRLLLKNYNIDCKVSCSKLPFRGS